MAESMAGIHRSMRCAEVTEPRQTPRKNKQTNPEFFVPGFGVGGSAVRNYSPSVRLSVAL